MTHENGQNSSPDRYIVTRNLIDQAKYSFSQVARRHYPSQKVDVAPHLLLGTASAIMAPVTAIFETIATLSPQYPSHGPAEVQTQQLFQTHLPQVRIPPEVAGNLRDHTLSTVRRELHSAEGRPSAAPGTLFPSHYYPTRHPR